MIPGENFTVPLSAFTSGDVLAAVRSLNGNMIELVRHSHEELLSQSFRDGTTFGVRDLITKMEEEAPRLDMKTVTLRPAVARVGSLQDLSILGDPFPLENAPQEGSFHKH